MAEREYDVVLFGATGFTGQLVAERLLERAPEGTRIALAGRSLAKLGAVRDALGPDAAHWPLLLADSSNKSTMTKLARSTIAVATTVGPFAKYGLPLVEACAKAGTHYADINGEVLFMRSAIDDYDEMARATGARIVHACGFDSLPSDLGVLVLHEAAGALGATTLVVTDMRGGVSGGTLATMRLVAEEVRADPAARAIVADPYALSPDRDAEPDRVDPDYADDESDLSGAVHDPELGWLGPVRDGPDEHPGRPPLQRPAGLRLLAGLPLPRGHRLRRGRRRPGEGHGPGCRAWARSGAAMGFGPTRSGIGKVLPKPGEGPSPEDRAAGHFTMEIHGQGLDGEHYVATVAAEGDPGYAATSLMLAEAVLFLASGSPDLPDRFGVLTPATGLGLADGRAAARGRDDVRGRARPRAGGPARGAEDSAGDGPDAADDPAI